MNYISCIKLIMGWTMLVQFAVYLEFKILLIMIMKIRFRLRLKVKEKINSVL